MQRSKLWTTEESIVKPLSLVQQHQLLGPQQHGEFHYSHSLIQCLKIETHSQVDCLDLITAFVWTLDPVCEPLQLLRHGNQRPHPWPKSHIYHKGSFSSHL